MIYLKTLKAVLNFVEHLALTLWGQLHKSLDKAKKKLQLRYNYEAELTSRNRREEVARYKGVVNKLDKLGDDLNNLI